MTTATFTPSVDDMYYLVVANDAANEGDYGFTSVGVARPAAGLPCLLQLRGFCP